MKTRMSQDEQTKLVDEVAKLVQEYLHARAVWEDIKVYGCRDPFWEDGCNMNLEWNHCIYYRDRIKELCERHSLPMPGLLSEYPIPPVVAEDYMAPTAKVKRVLQSVRYAQTSIERLDNLIAVIRSRAEKMTTGYSDAPGGGTSDRTDVIAKLIETERRQKEAVRQWCAAIDDVQSLINGLTDFNERAVLEHRYINCEEWPAISFALHFSLQHLYRIHGRALYKLSKKMRGNESL